MKRDYQTKIQLKLKNKRAEHSAHFDLEGKMRKLQTTDVFAALRIVKAAGVADEVKKIARILEEKEKTEAEVSIMDIGIEMIVGIMEKLAGTDAEKAFYRFLSGPMEIKEKDIATMDPIELVDKIMEMKDVVDVERWKKFFISLGKSIPTTE